MAALAEAFVRLRMDTSMVASDVKQGVSKGVAKADVEGSAKKTGSRWGSAFGKAAGAFAAIGILKFGTDSVKAFSEAEQAQNRLSDAFTKFPKLADVSKTSLTNLNTELAKKTRFDDDATASGQAVLAQFKLTGTQITQLTPLLQDYAAKTGKDLPTAARDLGKAMLGQGRGLKAVGINFKDTGTAGGNFNQIMTGLRTQVGGFAEKEGKTGAGQAAILKNQFGELQEQVGEGLLPILTQLIGKLLSMVDFIQRNKNVILPLGLALLGVAAAVKAVSAATAVWGAIQKVVTVTTIVWRNAQLALNLAMIANPIGLIVIGIVALIAVVVLIATRTTWFQRLWKVAWAAIKAAALAVFNWIKSNWPLILGILLGPIGIATALIIKNWAKIKAGAVALWAALKSLWSSGVRFIVNVFFDMVGKVLNGAAKAFGWVPKLGDKLKKAAGDFQKFRDRTNASLGGIKSRSVTVTAALLASQKNAIAGVTGRAGSSRAFATGGRVDGPGTETSDSIVARLSKNEHVLTASDVRNFGGHDAVMRMRKAAAQTPAFAAGGPVGFSVAASLTGKRQFDATIADYNRRVDIAAMKLAIRAFQASGGSGFSPNLAGALNFAKSQAGKPYIWGGVGPAGYDCSGFMSAIVNVAQGRSPYSRRFSTGTLPAGLFDPGGGAFNIGWFTGNPGHTAGTLNGVAVESRGGDGVVVGARSRGAGYPFFNRHGHLRGFAGGGPILPGDGPFDILDPRGRHFRPGLRELLQNTRSFDTGGWLPPRSATVAVNNTSTPERVRTGAQEDQLLTALQRIDSRLAALARDTGREVGREVGKVGVKGGRA